MPAVISPTPNLGLNIATLGDEFARMENFKVIAEQFTPNLDLKVGRLGDEFAVRENFEKIDAAFGALEQVPAGAAVVESGNTVTIGSTTYTFTVVDGAITNITTTSV